MITRLYHLVARLLRLLPKTKHITFGQMSATFFVPIYNHYICQDLGDIIARRREPKLYQWLNSIDDHSIYFDVGTSYGQECCLVSSNKTIQVFGFDCGLFQSHFCALNRRLNNNRFTFTFAAIAEKSGQILSLASNSDTHIAKFHKKNVPYEYQVTTLCLDDFSKSNNIMPTHLKIDVDGAEDGVLRGAQNILASNALREIFIEVDRTNEEIIDFVCSFGFKISWKTEKELNLDILFTK